jgi:hypothetical protein
MVNHTGLRICVRNGERGKGKTHLEKPLWEIWQIFAEVKKIFDKGEKSFPEFINEKYIIQIWEMQKMLRKYVKFSK